MKRGKFVIDEDMFKGHEVNAVMASGDGRRLWVSYCDGRHFFKVENLRNNCDVVLETDSLSEAIQTFNEL